MTARTHTPVASAARPADEADMPRAVARFRSEDLFQQAREVEIEHQGRIYRLRLTQMNKLILTA